MYFKFVINIPNALLITDCQSVNAELDIYHGKEQCIGIAPQPSKLHQVTKRLTTCADLFGSNATLITLPENDTGLWNYVTTFLQT